MGGLSSMSLHVQRQVWVADDIAWGGNARDNYLRWQAPDRKVPRRINAMPVGIWRTGNAGIGKPEALRHDFAGYWSRWTTDEHRLVCTIHGDETRIAACRNHYGKLSLPFLIGRQSIPGRGSAETSAELLRGLELSRLDEFSVEIQHSSCGTS